MALLSKSLFVEIRTTKFAVFSMTFFWTENEMVGWVMAELSMRVLWVTNTGVGTCEASGPYLPKYFEFSWGTVATYLKTAPSLL